MLRLWRLIVCTVVLGLGFGSVRAEEAAAYYAAINGVQTGPFTLEEVGSRVGDKTIGPDTLMWTVGMAEWAPAKSIAALADVLAPKPPPLPATPPPLPKGPPPLPEDALTTSLREMVTAQFNKEGMAGGTPAQKAFMIECYLAIFLTFTPDEQAIIAKSGADIDIMRPVMDKHPDFNDKGLACNKQLQDMS